MHEEMCLQQVPAAIQSDVSSHKNQYLLSLFLLSLISLYAFIYLHEVQQQIAPPMDNIWLIKIFLKLNNTNCSTIED